MLKIIPTPINTKELDGTLSLAGIVAFTLQKTDDRVKAALSRLILEIEKATGTPTPLSFSTPEGKALILACGEDGEGYRIDINENGIEIYGDGPAGAFWAVQSLRQLVRENGAVLPLCKINDTPDFSYRGFYHDITRGRVPTLEKLKEIVDTLAYFKINSLQLYVEDAFTFKELDGIVSADCALTPEEILELDAYCQERFIDLIPSMSTFGHLFTLLQSEKYNYISELPDHPLERNYWLERQWHHTVNVYHPDTEKVIFSMIEQYLPLFSSKYFNICCDETMDLCRGVNEGKDKADAYFYHVKKLCNLVKSYGKTVMLWGDECMAYPDRAREELTEDIIVLNWCYRHSVAEWIPKMFWERGFQQIACTGTSCWDNFMENVFISKGNIESFSAHAKKYGALGILNTNWGDFGHICPFSSNLYGLMLGAEKSWNADSVTDEEFERAATLLLYGITEFNMADTLRAMARAMRTCNWSEFVIWHSAVTLEGKTRPLGYGGMGIKKNMKRDAVKSLEICKEELSRLSALERNDSIVRDLMLSIEGIYLMNRVYLYMNKARGYTAQRALQNDINEWLSRYRAAWLCDNKPSGLSVLENFLKNITNVNIKSKGNG